jgi:two-component system LytT family response regulator/two-component system response regulator AlgR
MSAYVLRTDPASSHGAELAAARRRIAELEALVAQLKREPEPEFWTRYQGKHHRVRAADLDWVEAERDYVRLHTAQASFLHHESLSALEARLDARAFRRVHRSAIVRWDRSREVRREPDGALTVVTGLGARIRVGRTFAPDLIAALSRA